MGMLEIRTRQERLGNLGRTMSPDFRNGAAEAARAAGDAWAAAGRAARDAGDGLMSIAVTLGRVAEHDHRVRYDAFLADAREEFDAWMRGDGSAENPGKINEKVEDPARWAQEISARWGEVTRRHRERHGITDHEWESEVKEMVRPYGDQWTGRVLARALQVREHNALVSAQANVNADEALLSGGDGSPEVYRAYARHVEALLDAQGVTDPDARAAKRRTFALKQCEEGVKAFIVRKAREADDAAGAGGAKAGERVFDEAIAALGEAKDGKAFFPPNAVEEVRGADGRPAQVNIIRRWADGADMGAFAKAAADDLRRAKERWAARERANAIEGNRNAYDGWLARNAQTMLDLRDPKKSTDTANGLNYEGFCAEVDADTRLTPKQRTSIKGEYRSMIEYREKHDAALRKHMDEVAASREKDRSEYGWFKEDGEFVPASAFPAESDGKAYGEFNRESSVWQDPKVAMAKLEAARMTGRLSQADYRAYHSYGAMLMDDAAKRWWFENYGKLDLEGLARAGYGREDTDRATRKYREKNASAYPSANGVFARNKGAGVALYRSAADFVADSLSRNGDGTESLVTADTLVKVYDTVRRLARAGVDPSEAVRAILSPALQEGIDRDLKERLGDPEYFKKVVEDFRTFGTHFTDDAIDGAAAGSGTNWYRDRGQAVTDSLRRQGRVKVVQEK